MSNFPLLESFLPSLNLYSLHTFHNDEHLLTGALVLQDNESDWRYAFDIEINKDTQEFHIGDFEVLNRDGKVVVDPDDTDSDTYKEAFDASTQFVSKYIRSIISRLERE